MLKTRDPEEILYLWKSWHDNAGAPIRDDYRGYVQLQNLAAKLNGWLINLRLNFVSFMSSSLCYRSERQCSGR